MKTGHVNPSLGRELEQTATMREALTVAAEPARREAEAIAKQAGGPWMPRRRNRGTIVIDVTRDGVRLVNTDHAAHLLEWGSKNNPPHAPLRRGVRAAGMRLHEQ